MGIKVAYLEENKKMQDYYIVQSTKYQVQCTKYPQKYHLSQNTNPYFFIQQSEFDIRY